MSTISTIAEAPDKTPVQNDSTPWQQVVRRLAESRIAPFVVIALLVALAGSGYLFFSGPILADQRQLDHEWTVVDRAAESVAPNRRNVLDIVNVAGQNCRAYPPVFRSRRSV